MNDYTPVRTQRNAVLRILKAEGLAPEDFEWTEKHEASIPTVAAAGRISILRHAEKRFFFEFDIRSDHCWFACSPWAGQPRHAEDVQVWSAMLGAVRRWAYHLKQEIEAPDLWAEIERVRRSIEVTEFADEPLAGDERERVLEMLGRLEGRVERDQRFVAAQLLYLREAVDRMSKRDWLHTFLGVLVTIVFGVPEARTAFLAFWAEMLDVLGIGAGD